MWSHNNNASLNYSVFRLFISTAIYIHDIGGLLLFTDLVTGVARIFQQGGGAKARDRSDRAGGGGNWGVPLPR